MADDRYGIDYNKEDINVDNETILIEEDNTIYEVDRKCLERKKQKEFPIA